MTRFEAEMKKCPKCGSRLYDPGEKPKPMHMAEPAYDGSGLWIIAMVIGSIWIVAMMILYFLGLM